MVNEYTTSELAIKLGISKQATDKKLKKAGFIPTKKVINNRETNHYHLTSEQISDLLRNCNNHQPVVSTENHINYRQPQGFQQPVYSYHQPNIQPVNPQQNSTLDPLAVLEKYEQYIIKASKYELLEDKSKEQKKDVEHWQSQYFEKKFEFERLQENFKQIELENNELLYKIQQLEIENKSLKEKLEKKASFLGLFKK